ncbi:MAG: 3-dehydroquinate synthase, partial [Clostridiales bacterium]|nr:3-dehydroquinate synthase [Clostridiales bacterium]
MNTLTVDIPGNAYEIHIGAGLLDKAGELLSAVWHGKKAAVVSDELVWELYGARLLRACAGFPITPVVMPRGEGSKSIIALERVFDAFSGMEFGRSDLVLALGGG